MPNEATLTFAALHADDDVRRLALQTVSDPDVDLPAALQQIEGRQLARRKLPSWAMRNGLLFPPRLSMEQCSSEATARYKRQLVEDLLQPANPEETAARRTLTDLTGGFGVDFSFLAPLFARAVYVERLPHLCQTARHNFERLELPQAEVVNRDAESYLQDMPATDVIFVDPARRDGCGRKTVAIADCEPNLELLQPLLRQKSRFTLIKLSPMLDIHAALQRLQGISQVHVVSVAGECKELLLVMQAGSVQEPPTVQAVNLTESGTGASFRFTWEEENTAPCPYTSEVGTYLYEPNASLLKAGAHRIPCARFGLAKLHPNSHLYTADRLVPDFPGRIFRVETVSGFGKRETKTLLKDTPRANLTVRNFPAQTAELRKRLRLVDGGDVYLFATTLSDGRHALIRCVKA